MALASLATTPAFAQHADAIRVGTRVRVWEVQPDAPSTELIGRVRGSDTQGITLEAPAGSLTVPWSNVRHMDVSAGPKSGPRWKSGLIGALAGAIGGGVVGAIIGDASHHNTPKFAAAGIGVGGVLGGVIGTTQPGERWDRVETDSVRR